MIKDTNFFNSLSDDDKLLVSKISDLIKACENGYIARFSSFLDERQCELLSNIFTSVKFCNYIFYGGHENAKRKVLAIFSADYKILTLMFPIKPITFSYRSIDVLNHRDFLGALMSHQIKREMIGDILVFNGTCVAMIYNTVSEYIFNNVSKIGSVGVNLSYEVMNDLSHKENFIEIKGTVASLRLDSIVSLVTNLSREKSTVMIKKSTVCVNYTNIENPSFLLKENDIFSIRGYGKFCFITINGISKKQRLHVCINKFI